MKTVTIDGDTWIILGEHDGDRQIAHVDDDGVLGIKCQKHRGDIGEDVWVTRPSEGSYLSPTETAALREMLAPGAGNWERHALKKIAKIYSEWNAPAAADSFEEMIADVLNECGLLDNVCETSAPDPSADK